MNAFPRPESGPPPLRAVPGRGAGERAHVARASAWTLGTMVLMSALRLVSQMVLSYLVLPEHFGAVTLMRTFLTLVEMLSDVGIRNAVIYHPQGEERRFLSTTASVQLVRGIGMWLATCALAWPASNFYGEPLLLWLLPLAGLESVNNGLLAVRVYVEERRLNIKVSALLDVLALAVSIATSITWAFFSPGAWALALGPLVGGFVRAVVSHVWYRGHAVPFGWDRAFARDLFTFGRWVFGGTLVTFVAQQFHMLYLPLFTWLGLFGVYSVVWNFCAQASKPLTALANKVIIPRFAADGRRSAEEHENAVRASLGHYLPACMLVCIGSGLFAPALFGFFYSDDFAVGGPMGLLFSITVWFMILQQVPRSALLSQGASRAVAAMAVWNAGFTVLGIVGGWHVAGMGGAILGNGLGNVAGCVSGWWALRARGLCVGTGMVRYSLGFLAILEAGAGALWLCEQRGWLGNAWASLVVTCVACGPLAWWVWRGTVAPLLRGRRSASSGG
jgi:O-antigen/teichoic acid export membrane protein